MPASAPSSDRRPKAVAARVRRLRRSKIRKNVEEWRERSERNDDLVEVDTLLSEYIEQPIYHMSGWSQETKVTISRLPLDKFSCRPVYD